MVAPTPDVWATLLPVIIGGFIGLAGGLLGPPLTHWLNQDAAKRAARRARLEELMIVLYDYDHWLDSKKTEAVFAGPAVTTASPLPRAQAIAAIYFPSVGDDVSEVGLLGQQYQVWMFQRAQARLQGQIQELNEGLEAAWQPYYRALMTLQSRLIALAHKERFSS